MPGAEHFRWGEKEANEMTPKMFVLGTKRKPFWRTEDQG